MTKRTTDKLVEYNSKSELRNPIRLVRGMFADLRDSWELASSLLVRDINAKYRQSALGYLWAFIPALFTSVVFTFANKASAISVEKTDIPYPAFVVLSMVLWQTFVESINGPVQSISDSKVMLAKINFKREALIISKFFEVWFSLLLKLLLVFAAFAYFKVQPAWTVIFTPITLSLLILLGMLIGLFLSPFSLLYKDISNGLAIFMNLFLFLTPVLYPKPRTGTFAVIVNLNPVTHFIEATRKLTLGVAGHDFTSFWITSGMVLILIFVSWLTFRLAMPFAIERVTS